MIGTIYKITKINDISICYIGSTFKTIAERWSNHKKNNNGNRCVIYNYIKTYGTNAFKIQMIKEYDVIDKKHLQAYEQLWVNKFKLKNSCINKNNTFGILKKEKKLYAENKEEYKKQARIRQRVYYQKDKQVIKNKSRQYYHDNKQQLSKKIVCDNCGKYVMKQSIRRHQRSIKCMNSKK